MPKTISVVRIKSLRPCADRWRVFREAYQDRESVTWQEIVDSNGLDDLLWVVAYELPRPALVGLLAGIVARVEHVYNNAFPGDSRVSDCIAACKQFASGDIGIVALRAARASALYAAVYAAVYTAAANAARAASAVTNATAVFYVAFYVYAAVDAVSDAANAAANYATERQWQANHVINFMENYDEQQ